jgi:hypothetical protein
MLGHGQVQGFGEQYGMEFRRAMLDEKPDPWLVERHEREIFPLLHRRAWFAEASDFLLYDLVTPSGVVDEAVLAYSNGSGRQRSLVIYHTRFGSTSGTIRTSVKGGDGSKRVVRRSLAQGLGLPNDPAAFTAFRDARTGLEYLRSSRELWEHGLAISLDAYATNVFWEFRDIWDGVSGQWARLAARLGGAGVQSLDDALRELQLEPIHGPFRAIFADGVTVAVLDGVATSAQLDELERRVVAFLAAVAEATGVDGDPVDIAKRIRARAQRAFVGMAVSAEDAGFAAASALSRQEDPEAGERADEDGPKRRHGLGRRDRATLLAWLTLSPAGGLAPGADVGATSLAWYDELRVPGALVAGLHDMGFGEGEAWEITDNVRVLLAVPRPSGMRGSARVVAGRLLEAWLTRETTRIAIGLNTWEGVEYLDRDRLRDLLSWAVRLDAIDAPDDQAAAASIRAAVRLADAAEAAGYRVDRLRAELGSPQRVRTAKGEATKAKNAPKTSKTSKRRNSRRSLSEKDPPKE